MVSTRANINDSRLSLQRFEQRYRFDQKPSFCAECRAAAQIGIFIEDRAGRNLVDVINNTMINPLKKARSLQPYRRREHAAYLDPFKDPEGYSESVKQ